MNLEEQQLVNALELGEFATVLDSLQTGKIPLNSRTRKAVMIGWCLYEAVRDRDRAFLKKASKVSIMQDARGPMVMTRYDACGSSKRRLEVRRGVVSLMDPDILKAAPGAQSLADGVVAGLTALATRRAPHCNLRPPRDPPSTDHGLFAHIKQHVEMFTADGAVDEQLAGRLLSAACQSTGEPLFPKLRFVLRDKPHAS